LHFVARFDRGALPSRLRQRAGTAELDLPRLHFAVVGLALNGEERVRVDPVDLRHFALEVSWLVRVVLRRERMMCPCAARDEQRNSSDCRGHETSHEMHLRSSYKVQGMFLMSLQG